MKNNYVLKKSILKVISLKWNFGFLKENIKKKLLLRICGSLSSLKTNKNGQMCQRYTICCNKLPPTNTCRIMDKNFYLLNMNKESRKVFLLQPIVSFYFRKISDYLVRPKVYSLDRVIRSTKCGIKRC